MSDHDPMCRCKHMEVETDPDDVGGCDCALIDRARADERARHHRMEVQGGWVRTCCPMCKSHVQPHVRCMLRDDYTGPLPEGHRWDGDA